MTDQSLTQRQRTVLSSLGQRAVSARHLGVRSDVLWRLEQRGLVARNAHERWYITDAGRRVEEAKTWTG